MSDLTTSALAALEGITPGEWSNNRGYTIVKSDAGHYLAETDCGAIPCGEMTANATFIALAPTLVRQLVARVEELEGALQKVSDIRDSIVGMQGFNFSEHAYPLVAVLDAAGFKGKGYEISRANLGTLIEQRDKAEAESDSLRSTIARVTEALSEACDIADKYACVSRFESMGDDEIRIAHLRALATKDTP